MASEQIHPSAPPKVQKHHYHVEGVENGQKWKSLNVKEMENKISSHLRGGDD